MANHLAREKEVAVIASLLEGCSIRSTSRGAGVNRGTIEKLLIRVGNGCADLMNRVMLELPCRRIELHELWAFVGKKQRHVAKDDDSSVGDAWTWVAIDSDTKLATAFLVGKRTRECADAFRAELSQRVSGHAQAPTDTIAAPVDRESRALSTDCGMEMCRYSSLTTAFSKNMANHVAATALHFAHYNFCRTHEALGITPAVAARIISKPWDINELLNAALASVGQRRSDCLKERAVMRLFSENLDLADAEARRYMSDIEFDERQSLGQAGLLTAAQRFDPRRGVPFRAYARKRVRGAILDGARTASPFPKGVRQDFAAHQSATQSESGATRTRWESILAAAASVAQSTVWEDGEATTVDDQKNPEESLEFAQLSAFLMDTIALLPAADADLIRRHDLGGERLDHIAISLGVSKSWVSRCHTSAIERLSKLFLSRFEAKPAARAA